MKSILISIQPKWVEKIANGEKTIEVRKTAPKIETPFKCYIYCTQGAHFNHKENKDIRQLCNRLAIEQSQGKVIGEFICDNIIDFWHDKGFYLPTGKLKTDTCLTNTEFYDYGKGKPLYGLHISNLKIYDKPKELSEFYSVGYKECEFRNEFHICEKDKGKLHSCKYGLCDNKRIKRPPQSWCYVEI